jgi:hypothetical protein
MQLMTRFDVHNAFVCNNSLVKIVGSTAVTTNDVESSFSSANDCINIED